MPGGDYPVLEALFRVRLARREYDQLYDSLDKYLDRNKSPKFWEPLLPLLSNLRRGDPCRTVAFLEKLFTEIPDLVASREATHLLNDARLWTADFVDAQLDHWLSGNAESTRQAYGEIVALAAITQPLLTWGQVRMEKLLEDKDADDVRAGAALSAAYAWTDVRYKTSANGFLTRLLAGGGTGVWAAVFEIFRLVDELTADADTVSLLTTIADKINTAPQMSAHFIVERLATLLPHQAMLVGRISEGLINLWKPELGDIRTSTAIAALPQLVDLAVTLHRLGPQDT